MKGNETQEYEKNRIAIEWKDPQTEKNNFHSRSFNKEIVLINLPNYIHPTQTPQIKWLSVWCEDCQRSFGDLIFDSENPNENSCTTAISED